MNTGVFALGFIVLILGLFAAGYTIYENKTYFFGTFQENTATRPYSNLSIPLIVVGIILMFVSAIIPTVRTTTKKSYVETPVRKTKIIQTED